MPALTPSIDIQRASERMATRIDWLDSRHSFSFGQHHDPKNTHFGLLLVSNHDLIQPDTGFSTHPHRDMEIVTWVLDGELEHKDSVGNVGLIYPGLAQRMSAGSGILHSEINATKNAAVNLVQMWVVPDTEKVRPGYAQLDINTELAKGGLVPVASGRGHEAAIPIRQQHATLWAGRLKPNERLTLPDAPFVHLYVAKGDVTLEGVGSLVTEDAARIALTPGLKLEAGPQGAEVLAWEMHARIA
ncbi:MAG TPA: pirin family protein [Tepidiformaceae bacterium]|nr:pirin family protein [Tepidiformaceae bacterium]